MGRGADNEPGLKGSTEATDQVRTSEFGCQISEGVKCKYARYY